MVRRDFLKAGLAALGACAPAVRPAPAPPAALDANAIVARIDADVAAIAEGAPLRAVLAEIAPGAKIDLAAYGEAEELYRQSLRAIARAGGWAQLSEEERAHPEVERRARASARELERELAGITRHLETLPRSEREAIDKRLEDDPELPARMNDALDRHAKVAGVTLERRAALRSINAHVATRLRAQPMSGFIDEHATKLRNIALRQREAIVDHYATEPPPEGKPIEAPGSTVMKVGGILLGVGAGMLTLGGLVCADSSSGSSRDSCLIGAFLLILPGVVVAAAGLITLLVGLIIRSAS
jgi:hypothetical protein